MLALVGAYEEGSSPLKGCTRTVFVHRCRRIYAPARLDARDCDVRSFEPKNCHTRRLEIARARCGSLPGGLHLHATLSLRGWLRENHCTPQKAYSVCLATKTPEILRDLEIRAATDDDATTIIKTNGLPTLTLLLSSNDSNILKIACAILGNLAVQPSLEAEILASCPFERIVSLSMHKNPSVRRHSLDALNRLISLSENAARAIANGDIMNIATDLLLHSEAQDILRQTCDVLNNLARYDSLKVILAGSVGHHFLMAAVE
ncbi:hypothetical protein C8R45DRAFT_1092993 [Mycena sanguinolenta]|nr:hypothetical protein C8R45DRAFT_1092993 [Mycena sanguinolenta]